MALNGRVWSAVAHSPLLAIVWANAVFIYNHFYVRGPYLHDSGWFSALVYRNGLMPRSPESVARDVVYYWGWHPSLLLSLGSALSYLAPIGRIEWFAVFQAAIYAPLAFAVPLLVPKEARTDLSSAALTAACGLAFAFGGQVVTCIGFPHFEIFSAAGCAIMLAAIATGRERLAWVGLGISIATREDGGLHGATLLVAALASDFTGHPFPIARKRLVTMMVAGLAATAILIVVQKKLFVSVDAWKHYLAGDPPYAHLTRDLVWKRLGFLASHSGFVWMPAAATAVIAVVRRDPRYLLGWAVTLPWFLLNLAAKQDVKAKLELYTGFPFLGSAFWVGAYARAGDRRPVWTGWRWAPWSVGALSLLSLIGLERGYDYAVGKAVEDMSFPRATNRAGLYELTRELATRDRGFVRMDTSIASFAVDFVRLENLLTDEEKVGGRVGGDAFTFFTSSESVDVYIRSTFRHCGQVPRTPAFFCTTSERSLPAITTPRAPLAPAIIVAENARRNGDVVDVAAAPFSISTGGPWIKLERGHYVASWDVVFARCAPDAPTPHMHIDVCSAGKNVAASRRVSAADPEPLEIPFEVTADGEQHLWELRTFTGGCAFTLRGIDLRRVD